MLPRPVSDLDDLLAPDRLVELTQPLGEETALWPGSTPFAARQVLDYDGDGAYARELVVPEHAGTHLDAPAHFARGGRRVHELPLGELVRPLVKLDVRAWVADDASATIGRDVIEELERRDGLVPRGAAVLVHTGWDAYVRAPERYLGQGDEVVFPGLTRDAAELLVERGATGIGIDTLRPTREPRRTTPCTTRRCPPGSGSSKASSGSSGCRRAVPGSWSRLCSSWTDPARLPASSRSSRSRRCRRPDPRPRVAGSLAAWRSVRFEPTSGPAGGR